MKLKSIFLVIVALLVAALLPTVNFIHGDLSKASLATVKSAIETAYKTDHLTGWLNLGRTKFGYSSDPTQAVIGKDGWMYLGDRHAKSISVNRGLLLPPEKNYEIAKNRRVFISDYAQEAGVKKTYFMIAPNKESIYPENLPNWAKANGKPTLSARFSRERDETLIDITSAMRLAKTKYQQPIYLKTDSHWNDIGAWEAYKSMAKTIQQGLPELHFLTDEHVSTNLSRRGSSGDIASFLFLRNLTTDSRPSVTVNSKILIEISNIKTGKIIYEGMNKTIPAENEPKLIKSTAALNKARVLWLRDSFGTALSPFMAATFTETIQQHWGRVLGNDETWKQLIDTYQPDLVLFTIVERDYLMVVNNSK